MTSIFKRFFGVIADRQAYVSLAYLLLAFPLGLLYFSVLATLIPLGLGLILTLFGIPILVGSMLLWRALGDLERDLTRILLGGAKKERPSETHANLIARITHTLRDPYTWKSLAYLLLKFPIGIGSFVSVVVLLTTSLATMIAPVLFHLSRIGAISADVYSTGNLVFADTYWFTITIAIGGALLLFVSLHVFKGLGYLSRKLAEALLEAR